MKDMILIPIMLVLFVCGYYVMKRVDIFIKENKGSNEESRDKTRKEQNQVRIAAERPKLLDSVGPALESFSADYPHIRLVLSHGRADRLLKKLLDERIDIVLLPEENGEQLNLQCASMRILCQKPTLTEGPREDVQIWVVWKKGVKSKSRDHVIFALENEHCRLKCGYVDYQD